MRKIGHIGTWSRVVFGFGLVVVGTLGTVHSSAIVWPELAVGALGLPLLMVGLAAFVSRFHPRPLRLTGPMGMGLNCVVIVALMSNHVTAPAVELFYGVTLLVAAWMGQPGCEITVVPNILLRRNDQVGCPMFSHVDQFESRRSGSATSAARERAA